jgi:hypothetical protein
VHPESINCWWLQCPTLHKKYTSAYKLNWSKYTLHINNLNFLHLLHGISSIHAQHRGSHKHGI